MGGGSYSPKDWDDYATSSGVRTKEVHDIYTARGLNEALDPSKVKNGIREAVDSDDHPQSTPLIFALDVTGSMNPILHQVARDGLNTLVQEAYDRKVVTDPTIMCMAIGDAEMGDRAPLQVTQFEADIRIQQQLAQFYLEGGGGSNGFESYSLAHYFASEHVVTDSFRKRNKKGYLFTMGDEQPTPRLRVQDIKRVIGDTVQADLTWDEVMTMVARQWEVFHIIFEQGNWYRKTPELTTELWAKALGQRAIHLPDYTKLAEVIVSTIQISEGADPAAVAGSWSGDTSLVVAGATAGLTKRGSPDSDIVTL